MRKIKCNNCNGYYFDDQATNIKVINGITQIKLLSIGKRKECTLGQWNNLQGIIKGLKDSIEEMVGLEHDFCSCQYQKLLNEATDKVVDFDERKKMNEKSKELIKKSFSKTMELQRNRMGQKSEPYLLSKDELKKIKEKGDWLRLRNAINNNDCD